MTPPQGDVAQEAEINLTSTFTGQRIDLLRFTWLPVLKAQQLQLEALDDHLGNSHDLCVLKAFLARNTRTPFPRETRVIRRLIGVRREEPFVQARALRRLLFLGKPPAVRRLIAACCHAAGKSDLFGC